MTRLIDSAALSVLTVAAVLALSVAPARAQSQGGVSNMSCADYIKAETASGFTQGVTGKPAIDTLSAADTAKVHDYCASHPQENVRAAITKVKS